MTTTEAEQADPKAELEVLVGKAVEKINSGSMSMADLLKALAPHDAEVEIPAEAPLPVAITPEQQAAIDRVAEVFGKVVPSTRRVLEPAEVTALVEEKQTLDALKKMAEARQDSLRTTIFNHLDVEAEESGEAEGASRDKRGHYAIDGEVRGEPGTDKKFTREVRQNAPTLSPERLKSLVDDPEVEFTHQDYLAMTTQTRVVDEHKIMLALKKNPSLVHVIAKATQPGSKTPSLNLRKP